MTEIRKRIRFYGRVQGVGFRYRALRLARALGVAGWVKNEGDGSVLMEAQGSAAAVDRLLTAIHQEPYIRIEWMDAQAVPVTAEKGFRVL